MDITELSGYLWLAARRIGDGHECSLAAADDQPMLTSARNRGLKADDDGSAQPVSRNVPTQAARTVRHPRNPLRAAVLGRCAQPVGSRLEWPESRRRSRQSGSSEDGPRHGPALLLPPVPGAARALPERGAERARPTPQGTGRDADRDEQADGES